MSEKPNTEGIQQHQEQINKPSNLETQKEKKEGEVKFNDLMIVTSTLYRDTSDAVTKTRMEAALKFFQKAKDLQIKCTVLDGGSESSFIETLKKFDNVEVKIEPQMGIGPSRREALQMGLQHPEARFFLHLEPEKDEIIDEQSLEQIIMLLRTNEADIVVINRGGLQDKNSRVSKSMVNLQRWFEMRANNRANKILYGKEAPPHQLDIWFGVKMMNREAAEYFVNYKSRLDKWDSMVGPIFDAYRDNKKIAAVDVNFAYDKTQKAAEEKSRQLSQKRLDQYTQILAALKDPHWEKKLKK